LHQKRQKTGKLEEKCRSKVERRESIEQRRALLTPIADVSMVTRNTTVPSSMLKFRGDRGIEDPFEFLEMFSRIMNAHEIPEERYL